VALYGRNAWRFISTRAWRLAAGDDGVMMKWRGRIVRSPLATYVGLPSRRNGWRRVCLSSQNDICAVPLGWRQLAKATAA